MERKNQWPPAGTVIRIEHLPPTDRELQEAIENQLKTQVDPCNGCTGCESPIPLTSHLNENEMVLVGILSHVVELKKKLTGQEDHGLMKQLQEYDGPRTNISLIDQAILNCDLSSRILTEITDITPWL